MQHLPKSTGITDHFNLWVSLRVIVDTYAMSAASVEMANDRFLDSVTLLGLMSNSMPFHWLHLWDSLSKQAKP